MKQLAYGLLGAPLAMAALPLFVQLPAYYASRFGVALAPLGIMLFAARLVDMLQDPLLGHLVDHTRAHRARLMAAGAAILALAFTALWLPAPGVPLLPWLGCMLVLGYGAHSLVNIAYLAWGAGLPRQLGAVAWREGAGMAGMLVASVVPALIVDGAAGQLRGRLAAYCSAYALLLGLAVLALLRGADADSAPAPHADRRATMRAFAHNRPVLALLLPYFLNALAVAIAATLALFFIRDQLQGGPWTGLFLACYFGAAACSLPGWTALARRLGPARCWRLGMGLSVAAFGCTALLGAGARWAYLAICVASGATLGADLALPPVLLGAALGERLGPGAGFGLFTLLGKLALAVAGLALPLLAWLGYVPGQSGGAPLVLGYAVLPCLFKVAALATLGRATRSAVRLDFATPGSSP